MPFPTSLGSHHCFHYSVISHYVVFSIKGVKKSKAWMLNLRGDMGFQPGS